MTCHKQMKFFNLAFVLAFPGHNLHNRNSHGPNPLRATSLTNFVNLNVGGVKYSLFDEDIRKHPGSFFEEALESSADGAKDLNVERNGNLFKFVNAFMVTGQLPRNLAPETVGAIRTEAEYYRLPALQNECNYASNSVLDAARDISLYSYKPAKEHVVALTANAPEHPVVIEDTNSPVIGSLRQVLAPLCISGRFGSDPHSNKCKKALWSLHVSKLIDKDQKKRSNHIDDALSNCTYAFSKLGGCLDLSPFTETLKWTLKPAKLLIQHESCDLRAHVARDDGVHLKGKCVGTLEVTFKAAFRGGKVLARYNSQDVAVDGSDGDIGGVDWIAMHPNCTRTSTPVTYGTRVSVVFDIYEKVFEKVWDDTLPEICHDSCQRRVQGRLLPVPTAANLYRAFDSVSDDVKTRTKRAIDAELEDYDSILVGLQHLYPENHHTPSSALQGSDRALYGLLSEQFDVQVETLTIYRKNDADDCLTAGLYRPFGRKPDIGEKRKLFMLSRLTEQHVFPTKQEEMPGTLYLINALRVSKRK